jgi:hypothetical protein
MGSISRNTLETMPSSFAFVSIFAGLHTEICPTSSQLTAAVPYWPRKMNLIHS